MRELLEAASIANIDAATIFSRLLSSRGWGGAARAHIQSLMYSTTKRQGRWERRQKVPGNLRSGGGGLFQQKRGETFDLEISACPRSLRRFFVWATSRWYTYEMLKVGSSKLKTQSVTGSIFTLETPNRGRLRSGRPGPRLVVVPIVCGCDCKHLTQSTLEVWVCAAACQPKVL